MVRAGQSGKQVPQRHRKRLKVTGRMAVMVTPPWDDHRYPTFRNPGIVSYVIDRQGPALLP